MSGIRGETRRRQGVVNIGTASMIVILVGLCFAVLSALAVSSARNDYRLSLEMAEHTSSYYDACNEAYVVIDQDKWKDEAFAIAINDDLQLDVIVLNGQIAQWQVENIKEWQVDNTLPVFTIDE